MHSSIEYCTMIYTTLLITLVPVVLGYTRGPPVWKSQELCVHMIPDGHNHGISLANDTATPPFTITANADKYTAGGSLTVTIGVVGDVVIGGFFIMARRDDPARDNSTAIGSFAYPPEDTQLLDCHPVNNSAWGHSDDPGWSTVTGVWQAPEQDEGPIIFRATIVQGEQPNRNFFYLDVKSSQISFMAGAAITVEPPIINDDDAEQSTTEASTPSRACTHSTSLISRGIFFLFSGLALATRR